MDGNKDMAPNEYEEGPDFELVTRKKRGRRKGKPMSLKYFRINHSDSERNSNSNAEPLRELGEDEETSEPVNVIYGEKVTYDSESVSDGDQENNTTESSISWDGQLKAPPKVLVPETPEKIYPESPLKEIGDMVEQQCTEPIKYNTRALPKHAVTYEMEKFKKNALLILNHKSIIGYKPRLGTERDVTELERTFKSFGFEVTVENDLKKADITSKLQEFSGQDYTDYGCVAVAVLTHGTKHGLIRAKDQLYSELEVLNHFKVDRRPTLVTKPKIVIIQACRGNEDINAVPVFQSTSRSIKKDLDEEVEPYTLPVESDMLILHSSYIGKPSHRDELLGSWFIQSLCSKINQLSATHDLESIITEVKREVAIDRTHAEHNKRTFETDINKQMPVSTSTLIRKLYLKRYGDASPSMDSSLVLNSSQLGAGQLSTHNVLDNSSPNTPLYVQFGPCSCFLQHFSYMRDCLRYYIDDHPDDALAHSYLELATAFEDDAGFNAAKQRMLKLISDHLSRTCGYEYSKYLYFYK